MNPIRIQRKRTKGWRLPDNTVCVNRPSKWGNPYPVEYYGRDKAMELFEANIMANESVFVSIKQELKGKNLACFCKIDQPCHADILLKIANE